MERVVRAGEAHARKAAEWDASRTVALENSERRAWWVARWASVLTLLALVSLAVLAPFYKIVPVTFQVDRATGEAAQVETVPATLKQTEAMDRHWAARYVQTRERYVWPLLQGDFDTVLSMSGEKVARAYKGLYDGDNALDKRLGPDTEIAVNVISVTINPRERGRAVVSFERTTRRGAVVQENAARFVATLAFVYETPTILTREKVLLANPYGFRVEGYAVDAEMGGGAKGRAP